MYVARDIAVLFAKVLAHVDNVPNLEITIGFNQVDSTETYLRSHLNYLACRAEGKESALAAFSRYRWHSAGVRMMSTVILLSSSPPRVFARTPTPVGSSSPALPSASSIFKGGVKGYKKFKTAAVQRDGFTGGFTSCTALLRTKIGAENVPLPTQMNQKNLNEPTPSQKLPKDQDVKNNTTAKIDYRVSKPGVEEGQQSRHGSEKENRPDRARNTQSSVNRAEEIEEQTHNSLFLDKVSSRRLDWTPPVASAPTLIEPNSPASSTRSFPGGLLINFGYSTLDTKKSVAPKHDDEGGPTKRRRIDLVETGTRRASTRIPTPPFTEKLSAKVSAATRKRNKSPAKKYTTITRLATSHYRENELGQGKATPMLQYLTATQARAVDDSEEPLADTAKEKPKRAPKKLKKTVSRFKVLSPESAMKAFDSQEMMFGSASQLARDESPSFMRDTFEAMKQSESFLMSDPVSTQMTQPISTESTKPRTRRGTTRFTKTRNLWSAAGRDEDNALLHVDTMDLFDLPDLRLSFAGKDVLLEPGASRQTLSRSPEKQSPSLRGSQLPIQDSALFRCYDIDDITTPVARAPALVLSRVQSRYLHTAANNSIPAHTGPEEVAAPVTEDTSLATAETDQPCDIAQPAALSKVTSKPKLRKPVYAGFATHDLQKQISAFGFKPIKKREKMIEILERCWEDKHGPSTEGAPNADAAVAESVEALTHGDFLTKVHDISSRPLPKVNKPKGRPKKDHTEGSAENDAAKSPKKRKRADPKVKAVKGAAMNKAPRKREPRASSLSEVFVVDVDNIEDSAIESVNLSPPMKANPRRKSSAKAVSQPLPSTSRLATPPPTLPVTMLSSSPAFEPASLLRPQDTATNELPTASTGLSSPLSLPDIHSQITQAITTFKAPKDHNHQTNPTWHEKILMYDPIVLEDLAAWLNTEGLRAIGEDREVSALEVRTWCEAKGVCCLWRGGWRGNKARKDED